MRYQIGTHHCSADPPPPDSSRKAWSFGQSHDSLSPQNSPKKTSISHFSLNAPLFANCTNCCVANQTPSSAARRKCASVLCAICVCLYVRVNPIHFSALPLDRPSPSLLPLLLPLLLLPLQLLLSLLFLSLALSVSLSLSNVVHSVSLGITTSNQTT